MTAKFYERKKEDISDLLVGCFCILFFLVGLFNSTALKDGAIYGLRICVFNVIPTLFPFLVLSDLWVSIINFSNNSPLSRIFKRLFGISVGGVSIFIIGNLCGLPLGAKLANEKWQCNSISKEELENLTFLCSNPSPAFVISGVGIGLLGDSKAGILLYLSSFISSCIICFISKRKTAFDCNQAQNTGQRFNLINSIKNAGYTSIVISSYIIFFSALIGLLSFFTKNHILTALISAILEVGSACNIITESRNSLGDFTIPFLSFAISFSGLSASLQVFSILPPIVSKRKYLLKKLLQAFISAIIVFIFLSI